MRILVALLLAVFAVSTCAYAANESIFTGMVDKAVNGSINLLTGWIELPMQVYKGFDKGLDQIKREGPSKVVGGICGLFRGAIHGFGRTVWGAFELASFWAANPPDNQGVGVPLDAKYSWEMGQQYCIDKPNLPEGCKPIGTKFVNGLTDTLLGIVEVPAQISKSANNEDGSNVFVGFLRGMWYWISREVNGVANIASFLVPNPTENMGYAYNSKWPWTKTEKKVK
jgi:putative exosortase-associated protein (TIGR04073 family)